jgi:23S rRNA (pseudouridine1915-N3)-methyltransferase
MRISVLAVSRRLPAWQNTGIEEYARRLPAELKPRIIEITPARRGKHIPPAKALAEEAGRLRAALPDNAHLIVLDERARQCTTRQFAESMQAWQLDNVHAVFVIGGADGLDPAIREQADASLALSKLTLPHGLARLLLLEQVYRAWSLLNNHPYHRD